MNSKFFGGKGRWYVKLPRTGNDPVCDGGNLCDWSDQQTGSKSFLQKSDPTVRQSCDGEGQAAAADENKVREHLPHELRHKKYRSIREQDAAAVSCGGNPSGSMGKLQYVQRSGRISCRSSFFTYLIFE